MKLGREQRGDAYVLTPHGDLMGGDETRELRQAVEEIVASGVPKIVVDLGNISWMNSVGVGSLVAAHVSCMKRGGWLRIARIGRRIHDIFLVSHLVFTLDTYDTVEEALAAEPREGTAGPEVEREHEAMRRIELVEHGGDPGRSPSKPVERVR
jgi:anti-sigma B factor antagonist